MALVLQSEYSISRFQKSRILLVADAFSNMGKESRIRFLGSSNSVVSAFGNLDVEPLQETGSAVLGQPPYKIAGVDLSASWIDLVRENKVSASIDLPLTTKSNAEDNIDTVDNDIDEKEAENSTVEYGIRLVEKKSENPDETRSVFEEYVRQLGLESDDVTPNPLISNINATLAKSQERSTGSGVDFKRFGNFVAQLQLVRTLRPPPSEGFGDATTSDPPPYNPETDSFVTGPLRLDLRPLVSRLDLPTTVNDIDDDDDENNNILTTPWDVFHNISPADRRGHFLFLPSLLNKEDNWRGQLLTKGDCHDLVHLTSTIEPAGSMFLGYNSVGAGASQNHIHCHSWPYPSIGSAGSDVENEIQEGDAENYVYAINNVDAIYDFCDVDGGKVEVSYMNYPVFCIQMSASVDNLDLLGTALASCLEAIGDAPHNIGFLNRFFEIEGDDDLHDHDYDHDHEGDEEENEDAEEEKNEDEDEEHFENEQDVAEYPIEMVDVFIFARSKERSSIIPTLKLGISEMMGVFHAQGEAELDTLATISTVMNIEDGSFERKCAMELALADVTHEDEEGLWLSIIAKLEALENEN